MLYNQIFALFAKQTLGAEPLVATFPVSNRCDIEYNRCNRVYNNPNNVVRVFPIPVSCVDGKYHCS